MGENSDRSGRCMLRPPPVQGSLPDRPSVEQPSQESLCNIALSVLLPFTAYTAFLTNSQPVSAALGLTVQTLVGVPARPKYQR